ncbi:MAG: SLC13 family permease [Dehalobacterium sp.]
MNKSKKKVLGAIIGILAFIIIGFIVPPFGSLESAGMKALGIICLTISLLTGQCLPDYASFILMCTLAVVFHVVPIGTAFGAFAGSTFWLIIGILGLGAGINKSGLLKRLSLKVMTLFPPNFRGMTAALLGVGTVFAPLMPSTSAKQAIMGPVAMGIGATLGFEKKSKGMAGMFNAMYIGWCVTGTIFLSASFLTPIILGVLPTDVQSQFSWTPYFVGMIPWCIVLFVLSYFGLTIIYKPETNNKITKDYIKSQIKELGPMSREEKVSLIVLIICIGLWMTESMHHISTFIVAIGGFIALIAFGVFASGEFQTKLPWGLIFMVGGIMNMAPILTYNHVDKWLGKLIEPLISGLLSQTYLFVLVVILFTYAIRFVIPADLITPMVLVTTMLTPIVQLAGWNPWIIAIVTYCSVNIWCTIYQNGVFLVGWAACGGDEQNDFSKVKNASWMFMFINIIGLLISIPYWKMLGYIPK